MDQSEVEALESWWRAANYLSVGQIYLRSNPLLRRRLEPGDVKKRLLGHWGTTPGLNFVYAHLNRAIVARGQQMLFVTGPGHGGPANVANAYLEGTYTEVYPEITRDEDGLARLFQQFSFPGGVPSHAAPEMPGSISEGGELGYSLSHAYGAAFDNPDLVVACVVGDGEAETGPLSGAWQSTAFVDPVHDGAVLPILHLNGYKIANPTVLARMPEARLRKYLEGHGYAPRIVDVGDGYDHEEAHRSFAAALDECLDAIAGIQQAARGRGVAGGPADEVGRPAGADGGRGNRDAGPADGGAGLTAGTGLTAGAGAEGVPAWPMIVLRSPKGWTGPRVVDGLPVEGTWRAHQVPLAGIHDDPAHLAQLEDWLLSYRPGELFDDDGALRPAVVRLAPEGAHRMSATDHANGGRLLEELELPDAAAHTVEVAEPGTTRLSAMVNLGGWMREVVRLNPRTFRLFGPDETASNRLAAVYETTDKVWQQRILETDEHLARSGRVMEVLSEHLCQGWLEGYLLSGRHGVLNSYEAFVHIVDSMFNQHAKWLKVHRGLDWRAPVASLNYLLSSHVWQQDHNGFSHQDPGFIDHVVNKKADVVRVYLPVDANTLVHTMDHVMRTRDYVNVVVAGKAPALQWLGPEEARVHCAAGIGTWDFAGSGHGGEPDVVLGCAGDVPTAEAVAAAKLLRTDLPGLAVRVVNVVDLMRLQDHRGHPHGLEPEAFDAYFTVDKPVVFAYHGYPWLIHRLVYRQRNHANFHVRGYIEEGTTTTPFDMAMLNGIDRFHLALDVLERVPGLAAEHPELREKYEGMRADARAHTREHGEDPEEITGWTL
ncbi:phosphoketolase family protein [Zafaria sp. J156]|uniref:phosphoketolase family protein n=1 Tax=Zafaria sp. J156 TaxID=3116490 RepID=UPI002E7A02C8|nr:phosphoketolase family protein [Zafaria sp. J156]MEE1622077.1 phosphoketolase family protein [Zafaria sp. J156]